MHGIGGIWHEKNALTVNFGDIFVRFFVGFFVLNYQVKFGILYSANSVNFFVMALCRKNYKIHFCHNLPDEDKLRFILTERRACLWRRIIESPGLCGC